jgi:hypothetical protein
MEITGDYIGPTVVIKSLPVVLAESIRRIEGTLKDLEGYEVYQLGEIETDVMLRTSIGEIITTLRCIRDNCRVRHPTIDDTYQNVHNNLFLVPTPDIDEEEEDDHEGYNGDDDQDAQDEQKNEEDDHENHNEYKMGDDQDVDELDELSEQLYRCSMHKRQRQGDPNP